MKKLSKDLEKRNESFDAGNNEAYDDLHKSFTVNVNGIIVSLGSMDTYSAFCSFLEQADADKAYIKTKLCLTPARYKIEPEKSVDSFLEHMYKCINTDLDYTVRIQVKNKILDAYDNAQLMTDLVKTLENYRNDIA